VVVTNPVNLASLPLTFTVTNPLPGGVSVSAGNNALTLSVIGTGFVPTSVAFVNGNPRVTTYESSTLLQATLLPGDLSQGGTLNITVVNSPPGGGTTSPISVTVNPVPKEILLLPSSATLGSAAIVLQVTGSNYNSSSTILVNGAALPTTQVSATVLQATLPPSDMAQVATLVVAVKNPAPGGGTTSGLPLAVVAPNSQPVVGALSPASATAGGLTFTLSVSGSNFQASSVVSFGGIAVPTTFLGAADVQANIPASSIAVAGTPIVEVTNPGGVPSTAVTFIVNNPVPQVSNVSPSSATLGSVALQLQVTGSNFTLASSILVNGTAIPTMYVSATLLKAALPANDLAQAGTLHISVGNPPPGGGTSSPLTFEVTSGDFILTASPSSASVNPGQATTFKLTVAPSDQSNPNPIALAAAMQPVASGVTNSFAPSATIQPGTSSQTVMLTIDTKAATSTSAPFFHPGNRQVLLLMYLVGMAFSLLGFVLRTSGRRMRRMAPQLLLGLLIVSAVGLVACGAVGPGPSSPLQQSPSTGTPAGTYSITVTATSGAVVHTTTVTLTVM